MNISSATNIALTGMHHQTRRMNASASNVANIETDEYRAVRAEARTTPEGGVTTSIRETDDPSPVVAEADGTLRTASNTNLAAERVAQISATHAFAANVAVARTADEMQESLLDLTA